MAKFNLMETGIPSELTTNMRIKTINFTPANAYKMFGCVFKTFAELASVSAKKDKKIAVICSDTKGNLIVAATLKYIPAEESTDGVETPGGNWLFEFTTDSADLEDAAEKLQVSEHQFQRVFAHVGTEFNMRVNEAIYVTQMVETTFVTLLDNLKVNAKEGDVYEVEEEGYFLASAAVENGEIVIGITPGDTIKTLIKNDAADEK
jgi:hypothetical protein